MSDAAGGRSLRFELASESFERVRVDLGVAGFFENEIPLRGGAGRVDWRLCGLISEQLAAGRLRGRLGEALLIPAERRFRADRVMVLGFGPREEYRLPQIEMTAREVLQRAVALGVSSLALAPLGVEPDDFPRCIGSFVRGALAGIAEADRAMRLSLVLPEKDRSACAGALAEAIRRLDAPELSLPQRIDARSTSSPALPGHASSHRTTG
jgi:hypothetical protein